jgi:hypothetical protein
MNRSRVNGQIPHFGPKLGLNGPNLGRDIFFRRINHYQYLDIMSVNHNMQNQQNLMIFSRENGQKPGFGPILGPFGPNLGQDIFFSKIRLRHFKSFIVG